MSCEFTIFLNILNTGNKESLKTPRAPQIPGEKSGEYGMQQDKQIGC